MNPRFCLRSRVYSGVRNVIVALALPICGAQLSAAAEPVTTDRVQPSVATVLAAGDIAFSGYISNDPDQFSFVLLKNIGSGTVINFTDNGWLASGVFRSGEETTTWTATTDLIAGQEILIAGLTATLASGPGSAGTVAGTALNLTTGGDQIIAYQGTAGSPTIISAIHMNVYTASGGDCGDTTAAAWDPNCIDGGTGTVGNGSFSKLPPGMITGTNAIWIGTQGVQASEIDNARFTCGSASVSTVAAARAALNNPANWTKTDNGPAGFTLPTGCSYLVAPPSPTPTATATSTPTATATSTPTATATATSTPTATATATSTPTATATSTPTATATATATAAPTATATATATPTSTPTATATATATAAPTATATATATPIATPTATPTSTPAATPTASPTATATATPAATATATPTATPVPSPAQALNIATRMRVETGNNVLIGGFIITGNANKNIVLRGRGPSLVPFGITDALVDPNLELRSGGSLIVSNDDWQDDSAQAAQLSAVGLGLPDSKESGIFAVLQPGAYTAILAGKNQGTGVGLVEIYDTNGAADAQLANISTRGFVQAGNNVMIGGFILGGNNNTRVAARGIGPSLAQFGLSPVLADPTLELHDSNGATLATNDDWLADPVSAGQLAANGLGLSDSKEAGIFTSLPPGAFTVILAGKNGGIGIGLVEIYNLK